MRDLPETDNPAWAKFLEFIEDSDDAIPKCDVESELRRLGIDVKKAQTRVLEAVRRASAEDELDRARILLPKAKEVFDTLPSTRRVTDRERIKSLIAERCETGLQAAYFRKLEHAATDDDLRTLLEDLDALEVIPTVISTDERPIP